MGDRGNIYFVDQHRGKERLGMYMYSHWGGAVIPSVVEAALRRGRERWGDSQYLARIVFCELIKDDLMETTGYGLSTRIGDNEHAIVRVDDVDQTVAVCEPGTEQGSSKPIGSWSYEEFLKVATQLDQMLDSTNDSDDSDDIGGDIEVPTAKAKAAAKKKASRAVVKPKAATKKSVAKPKPKPQAKATPRRKAK
jgi:hypothetical protein